MKFEKIFLALFILFFCYEGIIWAAETKKHWDLKSLEEDVEEIITDCKREKQITDQVIDINDKKVRKTNIIELKESDRLFKLKKSETESYCETLFMLAKVRIMVVKDEKKTRTEKEEMLNALDTELLKRFQLINMVDEAFDEWRKAIMEIPDNFKNDAEKQAKISVIIKANKVFEKRLMDIDEEHKKLIVDPLKKELDKLKKPEAPQKKEGK